MLNHYSVAQAGSNYEKNWKSKISLDCPFNTVGGMFNSGWNVCPSLPLGLPLSSRHRRLPSVSRGPRPPSPPGAGWLLHTHTGTPIMSGVFILHFTVPVQNSVKKTVKEEKEGRKNIILKINFSSKLYDLQKG